MRKRQGVCDFHFRASSIVPVVFLYEVYPPPAEGLEVAVFVAHRSVYLAPCLLCFVGVVVGALLNEDVRNTLKRGAQHLVCSIH